MTTISYVFKAFTLVSKKDSRFSKKLSRREYTMKRCCCSVALVLLLLTFFSSKYCSVEGRSLLKTTTVHSSHDLQIRNKTKEDKPLVGEHDSLRVIPRSGSNPIQNKFVVEGSSSKVTTSRKP
ncbi:unnamed protein product [Cochlearia groenlandica]